MKTPTLAHIVASGRAIADVIGDAFCAIDVGGRQLTFVDLPPTFDELVARDAGVIARYHLRERFTGNRARDAATLKANNARKKKVK